ncbi:MAG: sporulation transcriptional regulator SpoIIID [Clostridia bacterium]
MIQNNILIEERALVAAKLFLEGKGFEGTVRGVSIRINRSKSSVYRDITLVLKKYDNNLATGEVYQKLMKNKEERSKRGGLATQKLYKELKKNNL